MYNKYIKEVQFSSVHFSRSVMSDSVQPHRRQPTRFPPPWDSPGKNTGVGCHFLLQCMKSESEVSQSCPTLSNPMNCSLPGWVDLKQGWDCSEQGRYIGCKIKGGIYLQGPSRADQPLRVSASLNLVPRCFHGLNLALALT